MTTLQRLLLVIHLGSELVHNVSCPVLNSISFVLVKLFQKIADNQKQSFAVFILIFSDHFPCSTPNHIQSCVVLAMNHIKAYCQKSSIDGVSYLVRRDLRLTEKVFWIVTLIVAFICCCLLVFEIGEKLQEDAMVTYTSDTAVAVTDVSKRPTRRDFSKLMLNLIFPKIPFASITYCPDLLNYNKVFDYNRTVTALKRHEITIDNVTTEEFVEHSKYQVTP
jgi:hypothetical protein